MKTKTNGFRSSVTSSVMALAAAAAVAAVFVIAPVTGQDAPAPAAASAIIEPEIEPKNPLLFFISESP